MIDGRIRVSLECPERLAQNVDLILRLAPPGVGNAPDLTVKYKKAPKGQDIVSLIRAGKDVVTASWIADAVFTPSIGAFKKLVQVCWDRADMPPERVFSLLKDLDFDCCAGASLAKTWGYAGADLEDPGIGFSDGHWNHGWMCAFKGKGHDRLVSRRWLDYGPWRLIRDETHDLSIVQFHDLNADDETALAQAKPGHERMGISETGGFIQTDFVWRHQEGASYDPAEQRLFYVVYGREVKPREMLEAAAVKLWQPLAKPVKQVAYVFMDEKAARAHLHEAWLHNVEVRTFINGAEVILTETYDPPAPKVPDWVKRLQDQEGR